MADAGGTAEGAALGDDTGVPPRSAGWYADPFGRHERRWWDGERWTAYAGGRDVGWDPEPLEEAVAPEPGVPGIGVLVLGFALGVLGTIAVARAVVSRDSDGDAFEAALASGALWLGLLGACVYVSRHRGSGSLARDAAFRFRWIDIPLGIGVSIAGRLLAGAAAAPIPLPTTRLRDLDDPQLTDPLSGWGWFVLVAVVCVGAPLVEEVFFRGLLQTRLVGRLGPVVGIAIGSVLFGAAHLIGWDGPLSLANAWAIAAGGLALGAARHYSGRLGPAVMGHVFFNVQAVLAIALLR